MSESIFELPDEGKEPLSTKEKLEHLKNATEDCVSSLLYYDRKEDEDLSDEDIEELMKLPEMRENIIKWFANEVSQQIKENFK